MIEIIHATIAIVLCATIVVQTRSSGLSATFGGSGAANVVQRRGAEKLIFKASIYLSIIFFALTIVRWYVY
jgi:protein translocase SecG subunit